MSIIIKRCKFKVESFQFNQNKLLNKLQGNLLLVISSNQKFSFENGENVFKSAPSLADVDFIFPYQQIDRKLAAG